MFLSELIIYLPDKCPDTCNLSKEIYCNFCPIFLQHNFKNEIDFEHYSADQAIEWAKYFSGIIKFPARIPDKIKHEKCLATMLLLDFNNREKLTIIHELINKEQLKCIRSRTIYTIQKNNCNNCIVCKIANILNGLVDE